MLRLTALLASLPFVWTSSLPRRQKPPLYANRVIQWDENAAAAINNNNDNTRELQELGNDPLLVPLGGDPSCPCSNIGDFSPVTREDLREDFQETLAHANLTSFGFGCLTHDLNTTRQCINCPNPQLCPWCTRSWCYVDPDKCNLLHNRGTAYKNLTKLRFYSYATCRNADSYTYTTRLAGLVGKTFRVGINHHPGGWLGAYHEDALQYAGPLEKWSGPVVDLIRVAQAVGQFNMELVAPPAFLKERSTIVGLNYFDECIYAASLGYLDFCVGTYAVTNHRATLADFVVLSTTDFFLVVKGGEPQPFLIEMETNVSTIFLPFRRQTWLLVVCCVIPLLGVLFLVNEYGKMGSIYPKESSVLIETTERSNREEPKEEFVVRRVPVYRHVIRSIYTSFLSVLQQGYDNSVVSCGSMLHLMGFSFFLLTLIAVYTANLAAILTRQADKVDVSSFDDAVRQGYKLCAIREAAFIAIQNHGVSPTTFISDPLIGGPGFASPSIDRIARVLDFIDPVKANAENSLPWPERQYCHAGLAFQQDLQVAQHSNLHCNKTFVGGPVGHVEVGIPIFEGVYRELSGLLYALKNDGWILKVIAKNFPTNACSFVASVKTAAKGEPLTIFKLAGIWFVSFGFMVVGMIVYCFNWYHRRRRTVVVRSIYRVNQHGEKINRLERGDSWVHRESLSVSMDERGNMTTHKSRDSSSASATASKFTQEFHIPESAMHPQFEPFPPESATFAPGVATTTTTSDPKKRHKKRKRKHKKQTREEETEELP